MFCKCSSLKVLDLSSFNTDKVTSITRVFNECFSLKKENIKINIDHNKRLKIAEY